MIKLSKLIKSQNRKLTRTNPQVSRGPGRALPATSHWEGRQVLLQQREGLTFQLGNDMKRARDLRKRRLTLEGQTAAPVLTS